MGSPNHSADPDWGGGVCDLGCRCVVVWCVATIDLEALVFNITAVKYLLYPPANVPKRTAASIVTLAIYFILLLFLAISYFRTFHVVLTNPGLVPVQAVPEEKEVGSNEYLDRGSVSGGRTSPPGGLEAFYNRELFECEVDGLPRWCSTCKVWKPDRSHHCSEIGRCVYKMDHYCPW